MDLFDDEITHKQRYKVIMIKIYKKIHRLKNFAVIKYHGFDGHL